MIGKLENPRRVAELNPVGTLQEIGLKGGYVFCDIGAGTGLFTFAATAITTNTVYAVDTSEAMLKILHERNTHSNAVVLDSIEKVPDSSCDVLLLCTVLHELDDVSGMACEIKRIIKRDGVLAVIEFHKTTTSMGPPFERRISEEETTALLTDSGFIYSKRFSLGENLYCVVFKG